MRGVRSAGPLAAVLVLLLAFAGSALGAARPGTPDTGFGDHGVVVPNLGQTRSGGSWSDAALQPDGKVVVVDGSLGIVKRYLPDGTPDPDFTGAVYPGPGYHASAVALQADGKILVAYGDEIHRLNPDGSLDSSFAGDGVLSTPLLLNDLAVQPDGAILGAGAHVYAPCTRNGCPKEAGLVRYLPDGTADDTFGHESLVTTRLSLDPVSHLALQPDGAILAQTSSRVLRYLPDGSLDSTFADGGVLAPSSSAGNVRDVGFRSGDVLVLLGRDFQAGSDFTVAAYDAAGAPDPTFNGDGVAPVDLPGTLDAQRLLVLPDGSLLVGASDTAQNEPPRLVVAKLDSSGTVDPTFGDGGAASFPEQDAPGGVNSGRINALLADPSGSIYFAGAADTADPVSVNPVLGRLTSGGSLDATFGSGGVHTGNFEIPSSDQAAAAAPDRRGRIIVAGSTNADQPIFRTQVAVVRLTRDGSPDTTFGSGGKVLLDLPSPYPPWVIDGSEATAVRVQRDGRILVAADTPLGTVLLRLRPNGNFDTTFGHDGMVRLSDVGPIRTLAQTRGGAILVASAPAAFAVTLVQLRRDGTRDTAFGLRGKVKLGYKTHSSLAEAAVTRTGRILVCGSDHYRFSLWRLLADGRPDPSFGRRGELVTGRHFSSCDAIRPRADGGLLAAGLAPGITAFTTSGTIDRSFGRRGRIGIRGVPFFSSLLATGQRTIAVPGGIFGAWALSQIGRLVPGFGNSGRLVPGRPVSGAMLADSLLQRGDLVLVGNQPRHGSFGSDPNDLDSQILIARYHGL